MSSVENTDDPRAAQIGAGTESSPIQSRVQRDWPRLAVAHIKVAALCPFMAATLFALIDPDRGSLLQLGGFIAFLVMILCTYVFFGPFAIIAVVAVSPMLLLISKAPGKTLGLILALTFGGGIGWLICGLWIKDVPAFQISAATTAALGAAALERAWRRTRKSP